MAIAPKVYDYPVAKVEGLVVSYLKKRHGESTVADVIAGTGLPKYQVEQSLKSALDEYAGGLKVTESGELLYYFPSGMRSTTRGLGPSLRRFWKAFRTTAAKVLSFAFKVWIVVMLVGYFLVFLAIALIAILASFAAKAAAQGDREDRSHDSGLGGMYLFTRLLDFALRMFFWSNLTRTPESRRPKGRPFYKSVFGFVFGDGDPNAGWDQKERKHILSYIQGHKGVITLEELMAITGREADQANALLNRCLLEFEGEPGVTEEGTIIYSFPALLRTSAKEQRAAGTASLTPSAYKQIASFSANKKKTTGWIVFFNAFNIAFGSYFLLTGLLQGVAAFAKGGPAMFTVVGSLLAHAGIGAEQAVAVMIPVLGVVPLVFSLLFFLIPLVRKIRLDRANADIRTETLRRRTLAQVLSSPQRVDAGDIAPLGGDLDPRDFPRARKRILERIAAMLHAEPVLQEKGEAFAYRFPDLEREMADLARHRSAVDLGKFEVGKTIFDSGQ